MKLSLMSTWTCSGPTGCHWCNSVPPEVPWLLKKWESTSQYEDDYVDEIINDANMDLQWPHRLSLMPPSPTYSALTPYKVVLHFVVLWIPYNVGLCLEAPCTQLTRSLYPQAWILKPPPCRRCWRPCWRCWRPMRWFWRLDERWKSINDPFCGHLCFDGVMVP